MILWKIGFPEMSMRSFAAGLTRKISGKIAGATSVERLATSMESMLKEQERQGKRLETLENRDGEMWRKVVGYAVTFMVGAVLAFLFAQIGL